MPSLPLWAPPGPEQKCFIDVATAQGSHIAGQHSSQEEVVPARETQRCIIHEASYPACSAEHLEVQRVSGELALDLGQRVAGGHAGDKPGGRRPFLSDF